MILTCKECDTSFNFDERLVKSSGSKVRCSKCRSIFTVFPPAESEPAEALEMAAGGAGAAAAGLDDVDVDEIVSSLELEPDALESAEQSGDDADAAETDLKFDLNFDEEEPAVATKPSVELEETQELDLSDLDLDKDAESPPPAADAEDELSFDLDLDEGAAPSDAAGKDDADAAPGAGASDELDFELDLGLDDQPSEAPAAEAAETKEDLDFDLDFDLEEDKTSTKADAPAVEDELDFSLDLDLDEEKAPDAEVDGLDFDETQALESTEEVDLVGLDEAETDVADDDDALDFNLDLDSDQVEADDIDLPEGSESADELDFDLDLEAIGEEDQPEGLPEATAAEADAGESSLDFDLDSALASDEEDLVAEAMEETEELDLTGLEDALDIEESADTSQAGADADDSLDLDFDLEAVDDEAAPAEGEYDLSELDMALDSEQETQVMTPEQAGGPEDFGIELDVDESAADGAVSEEDEEEDIEFDLSDLDDMLEIEEDSETAQPAAGSQDFDLELDMSEDASATADEADLEAAADVELDFEEDDESSAYHEAVDAQSGDAGGAGFDMGSLSEMEEPIEAEDSEAYLTDDEMAATAKPAKAPRKKMSGFFKFLLILVLLGGGGYAGYSLTQFFGIDIPYLDQLKSIRIPYVSDFLGQEPADPGNLRLAVVERDVNGRFVKNVKLGDIYVIDGTVRNNYPHRRSFVSITGKLYVKGKKLFSQRTVYAGNILTDEELARFDQAALDKFFKNRFGQKRTNLNLKKGATVPFMIVFSDLPDNLDEFTVQAAGSLKVGK